MNGVHFNYTNAAPHVAHYRKEREREREIEIKMETEGLWRQRKGLKATHKIESKGGATQGKHVNMESKAANTGDSI